MTSISNYTVGRNSRKKLCSKGSEFELDKTQKVIFESIVRIAWDWESEGVASIGEIVRRTELSKYMVRKHIKLFMEHGFLESGIRRGGIDEISCKPYPPLKGYKLTDKAKQIDLYKVTKADEDKRFEGAFCIR